MYKWSRWWSFQKQCRSLVRRFLTSKKNLIRISQLWSQHRSQVTKLLSPYFSALIFQGLTFFCLFRVCFALDFSFCGSLGGCFERIRRRGGSLVLRCCMPRVVIISSNDDSSKESLAKLSQSSCGDLRTAANAFAVRSNDSKNCSFSVGMVHYSDYTSATRTASVEPKSSVWNPPTPLNKGSAMKRY